jgi:hypothetical protein
MTIKLSYSILHAWEQGRYEEAVAQYLGKPFPATPAMELGKLKHELWERYVNETGCLPLELGGGELKNPLTEHKYEKTLDLGKYTILIRGVIDLEYDRTLVDYKCGVGEPSTYLSGWQLDLYKWLRPDSTLGKYICFNPYTESVKVGAKFLGEQQAENAVESIITYGSEMIDYLRSQKLLKNYERTPA